MQNEERIHFWQPESISDGDLVWLYEGNSLIGPLFAAGQRAAGYGSNKKLIYKLLDTSTGSWYNSEIYWIRVPMEIT